MAQKFVAFRAKRLDSITKIRSFPKKVSLKPKVWKLGQGRVGVPNTGLGLYLDNYMYYINFNYSLRADRIPSPEGLYIQTNDALKA